MIIWQMKKLGYIDWLTHQLHFQWQNENHNPDELVWVLSEKIQNQCAWDISDFFHPKDERVEVFVLRLLAVGSHRFRVKPVGQCLNTSNLLWAEWALTARKSPKTKRCRCYQLKIKPSCTKLRAKAIQAGVSPNSSLHFILIRNVLWFTVKLISFLCPFRLRKGKITYLSNLHFTSFPLKLSSDS